MKFFKLTKNEVLVFQSILIFSLGILYLFTPYPSNVGLIISYTVLLSAFAYISGWLVGRDKENGVTDFLKTLLPASVTLAATIWLLSSGYLNVQAENLKSDIIKFEKEKSNSKDSLRILKKEKSNIKDSLRIFKNEKDSLSNLIEFLNFQLSNFSETEKDNATLNIENKKIKNENNLFKTENRVLRQKGNIMSISNINHNKREVFFTIKDQRGRLLSTNELSLSWYNRNSSERKYPNPTFDKKSKKYSWLIPAHWLHSELTVELDFNFPNSTTLSDQEIDRFRKNNRRLKIDPFSAEYEIIVYMY